MSAADPDSVSCECGHMRGTHKAREPHPCATLACGCRRFRIHGTAAPAVPEPPRAIQGRVERELPPAAPERVTLTRVQLAICPACDVDRCDTCLQDGCACACNDTAAAGPQDPQEETMTTHPGNHGQPPGSAAANFAVHLSARLRALGWTQAHLTDKSGLSAHVTGRALNGNGIELANAEKIAGLVGSSLPVMIGSYTCSTCDGMPPRGFACLECGTEARAA